MRLRVLFVAQFDFDGPTEKQAAAFAGELRRRGHEVMFSLGRDPRSAARNGVVAGEGLRLHAHRFAGTRLRDEDLAAARSFAPTHIQALNPRLPTIRAASQLQAATGAPVCVHFEDDEWHLLEHFRGESPYHWAGAAVRRLRCLRRTEEWPHATRHSLGWVRRRAAGLDAISPALAREVERRLGRSCEVILPPALPAGRPDAEFELPPGIAGREIAMVTGTILPVYLRDVMLGLRAVAEAQRRGHDLAYVHAGLVHPRKAPDRLAAEAGLTPGSWLFTGLLPFPLIPGLLRRATVLLAPGAPSDFNRLRLPARLEPYLASGRPTIVAAIGSGELLEDGREVLKTRTAEPAELADRIVEVLADPDLGARLGEGGRAAAARLFDPVANTDRLEAHYRSVSRTAGAERREAA